MKKETKIKLLDFTIIACDVIMIVSLLSVSIAVFVSGIYLIGSNGFTGNFVGSINIIGGVIFFGLFIYYILSLVNKSRIAKNKKPLKMFRHKIQVNK